MPSETSFSRPQATAATLGALAPDAHRFVHKSVLLTGEAPILRTANGTECFLSALRLLPRVCANIVVDVPKTRPELRRQAQTIGNEIGNGHPIRFADGLTDPRSLDAILAVGTNNIPGTPSTVINSNGWLARISSNETSIDADCGQFNPIAALAAASLGVSEVFKRLISLKPERGPLFDALSVSLHSYDAGVTDPGPEIPADLALDLVLVGAGAIGNGIIHLLRTLPATGTVHVVDPQDYGEENLGTCLLIGPRQIQTPKAQFAASLLRPKLNAIGYSEDLSTFSKRFPDSLPYPLLILNGLDNIDARHDAQKLWPDLIIDGAIGQFECQVSCHPWGRDVACLMCLFRKPVDSAELIASRATGLDAARVRDALATISEADVANAPAEKREFLRQRVGKQICSVVSEAVAQAISTADLPQGFRPSVPFVACFSACMAVAELVRTIAGWPQLLEPRFQLDLLWGPARGQHLPQQRRRDCICATRAKNIATVKASRTTAAR